MRLAICNETFQEWPFPKAFAKAKELGYEAIEFAPFTIDKNVYNITAEQRETVRDQVLDAGLEVTGLHWLLAFTEGYYLTSPEADVRKKTTAYLEELARLCRDLTGSIMVLGSPFQRNLLPGVTLPEAMGYAADVIKGTVDTLAETGITLALEPLSPQEGDFLLTADEGAELCAMVDSPNVRLHLDVKAMCSEATPIPDIIRKHKDLLHYFHANDANMRGPGMGDVDFMPILGALQEVGYDGWVSVEVFDYDPGVETLASDSIRYLQECLSKL